MQGVSNLDRYLLVSVTFLDPLFHGRADGDESEWPPSPLRLFQALLAGAAAASRSCGGIPEAELSALRWLELQKPPLVVAPVARRCQPYRLSVPNNAMDVVAAAWARGNESGRGDASPLTHRSMKMISPVALESGETVHYVWRLQEDLSADLIQGVSRLANSIIALGWGTDLVFGRSQVVSDGDISALEGERWTPIMQPAGVPLRTPVGGTLEALIQRHALFLGRLSRAGGFTPTPALTRFRRCHYARSSDRPSRTFAALQFLSAAEARYRSFRATQSVKVAAMVRHCVSTAASETRYTEDGVSADEWLDRYVHGHFRDGATPLGRFSYLPLPTIDPRGVVDRVRRVIVAEPLDGAGRNAAWVGRVLVGEPLVNEQTSEVEAVLAACPSADFVLSAYTKPSLRWATVTPVVLPWGDSGKPQRAEKQFMKAVRHAGYSPDDLAAVELRREPFWRGCDVANRYFIPKHLRGTAVWHVSLEWKTPIAGPVAIGSGRFCGLGLFARVEGPG
jgi:CRISPR-associated protein Csb2